MSKHQTTATLHATVAAYRRAHPDTVFLLGDDQALRERTIRAFARLNESHVVVTATKARFPGCKTVAFDDLDVVRLVCKNVAFVTIDGVSTPNDVKFAESLDSLVLVTFAQRVRNIQLAWSALGGARRTYVIRAMADELVVDVARRFYTIAEVAVMLGFSEQKTYTDARAGRFPNVKVGGSIVIPIAPFEEWLNGIHSTPYREN